MALLDAELNRIRFELGFNLLEIGAEPYIGVTAIFENVVQPYTRAGAATTSSTAVTAAAEPTLVTLTLASATGFDAGARVVVDVDARQEIVTVRSVAGSTISAFLQLAHPAGYPVTVEGGESIIREILASIRDTKAKMARTFGEGTLRKVDEIEFYSTGKVTSQFGNLGKQLAFWRAELASALGMDSLWAQRAQAGATIALY